MSESIVRIRMDGHGRGEVFINGKAVPGVTAAEVKVGSGKVNEVILSFMPGTVEIDGTFEVKAVESDERENQAVNEG